MRFRTCKKLFKRDILFILLLSFTVLVKTFGQGLEDKEELNSFKHKAENIVPQKRDISGIDQLLFLEQLPYRKYNVICKQTSSMNKDGQEACAVAHFIYLCRNLFYITGDPKYINHIEKNLYNNVLCSKNPQNTFLTSYYSPFQGFKKYSNKTITLYCFDYFCNYGRQIDSKLHHKYEYKPQHISIQL